MGHPRECQQEHLMEASESIRREITIDADAATVFAFFTDRQRLIRWMGVSADPRTSLEPGD
jgi:uncharacterized protein YndB with AHSA1/START domain